MSKAILVMDMPKNCLECPIGKNMSICIEVCIQCPFGRCAIDDEAETIPKWCPLREVPQKIGITEALEMERVGNIADVINSYNACIDNILKGAEENG